MTTRALSLLTYAAYNTPYFNAAAVFSDETVRFAAPVEGAQSRYRFRLRTACGNADETCLVLNGESKPMRLEKTEGIFDYFTAEAVVPAASRYRYIIEYKGVRYAYNRKGLMDATGADTAFDFHCVPDFVTPDWAKGAVMYQIFVDRFHNGDRENDVQSKEYLYLGSPARKVDNWYAPVEPKDVSAFYGGDLQGVINKLEYLQELGVEAIYLNPIFVSPSNHKYDVQDYDYVDPHYGVIVEDGGKPLTFETFRNRYATMYMQRTTQKANLEASNALFAKLIALAHAHGIRVILDGVFNHCGAWNKWMDKENFYGANGYPAGAYREENSPYHNYFRWYDENWPANDAYDAWWGHDNHPKLNYEDAPELHSYMMEIAAKWVSPPYNADGWRLDVAADLGYSKAVNHAFWRDFRSAVKRANPEAIILAEHYGDPAPWLDGEQWDTVMNYDAFMEPVTWFFTGMEKHSEDFKPGMLCNAMAFEEAMRFYAARFPQQALEVAMNQLSNHDHSRFLTRTNMTAGRLHTLGYAAASENTDLRIMMEAVVLQLTWPGAPTLYYGDEAGLPGWTDPDNRRSYPWGRENPLLLALHKAVIAMRRASPALRRGSHEYLYLNTGIISFARFTETEIVVAAFNNNTQAVTFDIPIWKAAAALNGSATLVLEAFGGVFTTPNTAAAVTNGKLPAKLPPRSCAVWVQSKA